MPDSRPPTTGADDNASILRQAAAAALTSIPEVVRLEPTLSNALLQLQNTTIARAATGRQIAYSAADGIRLTQRSDVIDVHVDITVATTQPANLTAQAVRDTLTHVIKSYRLTAGRITVTVLRLHP